MQLSGIHTTVKTVSTEVSSLDVFNALKKEILQAHKLPSKAYVLNGKWVHKVEYASSHSWTETETIRPATPEEEKLYASLNCILRELTHIPQTCKIS